MGHKTGRKSSSNSFKQLTSHSWSSPGVTPFSPVLWGLTQPAAMPRPRLAELPQLRPAPKSHQTAGCLSSYICGTAVNLNVSRRARCGQRSSPKVKVGAENHFDTSTPRPVLTSRGQLPVHGKHGPGTFCHSRVAARACWRGAAAQGGVPLALSSSPSQPCHQRMRAKVCACRGRA